MTEFTPFKRLWVVKEAFRWDDRDTQAPSNLAYITYCDTNDKALAKRQQTGRDWAKRWDCNSLAVSGTELEFDNTPVTGVEIIGYGARYSTDNKTIRIRDPRGFEAELYIDHFVDLLNYSGIENKRFTAELIWVRTRKGLTLTSVDHPDLAVERVPVPTSKLIANHTYCRAGGRPAETSTSNLTVMAMTRTQY